MAKYLVIVESPAKTKTIKKILGNDYTVLASKGHIMGIEDSGYKKLGIEVLKKEGEDKPSFKVKYKKLSDKAGVIKSLKLAIQNVEMIYLATDADREGHRISAELINVLKLKPEQYKRIIFHEITPKAIKEAIENPIEMDQNLLDAQETRASLDKIVGYMLSNLSRKTTSAPSVGRCQSAALKIIVNRENEIRNFIKETFFEIYIDFLNKGYEYTAQYVGTKSTKLKQLTQEDAVYRIQNECKKGRYKIYDIVKSEKSFAPPQPFITSSLQIEASNKLGYTPERTMRIAQKLYEGVDIDGDRIGLITYMRTDAAVLSEEIRPMIRKFILDNFPTDYLGPETKAKSKKSKNAQEAHEAIRPTYIDLIPDNIKESLSDEEYKLYKLIWNRTLASEMTNRVLNLTKVQIENGSHLFDYNFSSVKFYGWSKLYETENEKENQNRTLDVNINDPIHVTKIYEKRKETQPPKRYTEATLVKELENNGIGRPSTYATLIKTILDREYTNLSEKKFIPSDLGFDLINFLNKEFPEQFDLSYTSQMEEVLDLIAKGEANKIDVLDEFFTKLNNNVIKVNISLKDKEPDLVGKDCPECGNPLKFTISKFGNKFISCTGFPDCKHVEAIETSKVQCPVCEKGLITKKTYINKKTGKKNFFFACNQYPKCSTTMPEQEWEEKQAEAEGKVAQEGE